MSDEKGKESNSQESPIVNVKRDLGKAAEVPKMQKVPNFTEQEYIEEAAPIPQMQRVPKTSSKKTKGNSEE